MALLINKNEIESVIKLPALKRYQYFIKRVADTGKVWGLYQEGWALAGEDGNHKLLPLWPAKEYATLCAQDEWKDYKPQFVNLNIFLSQYIDDLEKENIFPTIFYTPNDLGLIVKNECLVLDLARELKKVE